MKRHRWILRAASWIVPRAERDDFLAEWTAELWYVERKVTQPTAFCLGAFRDAWWLRCYSLHPAARQILRLETPLQCISVLAVLAALTMSMVFSVPTSRKMLAAPPYRNPRGLVMVNAGVGRMDSASVSLAKFQTLEADGGHWFSSLAYYQPAALHIRAGAHRISLAGARASQNLFDILGVPVAHAAHYPALVVNESAWRRLGGAIPEIDGHAVEISAVIADAAWRLPADLDAWLLLDDSQVATLPPARPGFVVARHRGALPNRPYWYISIPISQEEHYSFECQLPFPKSSVWQGVVTMAALGLVLLGTTRITMGQSSARRNLRTGSRLRGWLFFLVKSGLVSVILFGLFCITMPLAQAVGVSFILAFRWVLVDQRRRCPVCLHTLSNPVRIGRPSQTFLEWYGTELICAQGHGLLHVSEVDTSCYSGMQWTYLDRSWSSLFSDATHSAAR